MAEGMACEEKVCGEGGSECSEEEYVFPRCPEVSRPVAASVLARRRLAGGGFFPRLQPPLPPLRSRTKSIGDPPEA
jgi:hypothetical protein